MICMSYELITMIVGFTALALYIEHCTRTMERAIDRGLRNDPKDER